VALPVGVEASRSASRPPSAIVTLPGRVVVEDAVDHHVRTIGSAPVFDGGGRVAGLLPQALHLAATVLDFAQRCRQAVTGAQRGA